MKEILDFYANRKHEGFYLTALPRNLWKMMKDIAAYVSLPLI